MDTTYRYSIEISPCQLRVIKEYISNSIDTMENQLSHFSYVMDNEADELKLLPSGHIKSASGFKWTHEEEVMFIELHEEGKMPLSDHTYYVRSNIYGNSLPALKKFLSHVIKTVKNNNKHEENSVLVYCSNVKGYFDNHNYASTQPFDSIYLPKELKESLVDHVDMFIRNKSRYIKFGRMFKTAFLLTGLPGSGKSSLVKAIAHKYKRPIYVINLTKELTDEVLLNVTKDICKDSIMLIEDVDAFFIDRSPNGINVSFSALLNLIDGPMSISNGLIIFLTANNPDRLDPALIRPGRVDRIFTFDYPRKTEIRSAFVDLTGCDDIGAFNAFYDVVKGSRITMSAFVDFLFRYPDEYMKNIDELLSQTRVFEDITNIDKKLYS